MVTGSRKKRFLQKGLRKKDEWRLTVEMGTDAINLADLADNPTKYILYWLPFRSFGIFRISYELVLF